MHYVLFFLGAISLFASVTPPRPDKSAGQPVVVLELFTSQGCSSCPPADKVLHDVMQHHAGQTVFALAFHVDYWDRLGWKDPFSSKEYTARQRQYDRTLTTQTYTPQLIVNGRQDIIGGQRERIDQAIQAIQKQPASEFVGVDGSLTRQANQVVVHYTLSTADSHRVNIALVQKEARTQIKNGENGGRTLLNTNIVRQFKTIEKSGKSGNVTLSLPANLTPEQTAVLVYVQRNGDGQVVGARLL